jgi:hypothetical protein
MGDMPSVGRLLGIGFADTQDKLISVLLARRSSQMASLSSFRP